MSEPEPPRLADQSRWDTEHMVLLISSTKWALLEAAAGLCVPKGNAPGMPEV